MAVVPQIITETKASGAQVIDGSLKFDLETSSRMTRSMTDGNRGKFTISCWLKPTDQADYLYLMGVSSECSVYITNTRKLHADFYSPDGSSWAVLCDTDSVFRDPNAFYHIVAVLDSSTGTTNADRFKFYVNGVQQTIVFDVYWGGLITGNVKHVNENGQTFQINSRPGASYYNSFYLSQYNYIDGQALGPEYFGFTDPLTNTWRPKKYTGEFTSYNANAINDGSNWNSYFTGDYDQNHGWGTLYESANAFDGDLSSKAIGQANSTGLTWTAPGGGIGASATTIRIYGNDDACPDDYLKINGVNYGGLITQGFTAAYTVLKGSGAVGGGITQLESIYLRDNASGNTHYRWIALEIDGVVLVANQDDRSEGTNSFYLPMDGNSPIGEDKSGQGNDWTPVNFGGSNSLDKATGAKPILNTLPGGTIATPGVFGSEENQFVTVTVASKTGGGNAYFFGGVERDSLASLRGTTVTFDTTDSTNNSHPFKLSSTNADSSGGTEYTDGVAYYINGSVTTGSDYVTNYSSGAA